MPYTPPQPERDEVDPEERAAYDRVIRRQTAYRYDEFEKILPATAVLLAYGAGYLALGLALFGRRAVR